MERPRSFMLTSNRPTSINYSPTWDQNKAIVIARCVQSCSTLPQRIIRLRTGMQTNRSPKVDRTETRPFYSSYTAKCHHGGQHVWQFQRSLDHTKTFLPTASPRNDFQTSHHKRKRKCLATIQMIPLSIALTPAPRMKRNSC